MKVEKTAEELEDEKRVKAEEVEEEKRAAEHRKQEWKAAQEAKKATQKYVKLKKTGNRGAKRRAARSDEQREATSNAV